MFAVDGRVAALDGRQPADKNRVNDIMLIIIGILNKQGSDFRSRGVPQIGQIDPHRQRTEGEGRSVN